MARSQDKIQKRNEQIMEEYNELFFKGMMRQEICIKQLADKHFLSENTVYRIMLAASKKCA